MRENCQWQINVFFNEHNSLCEHQNDFRPGHSTMDSIVHLANVSNSMNKSDVVFSVFTDLKKGICYSQSQYFSRKI